MFRSKLSLCDLLVCILIWQTKSFSFIITFITQRKQRLVYENSKEHIRKVFKTGSSSICGRQLLKNLKGHGLL